MDAIYGQKLGMTRIFSESGDSIGATVIKVEPARVIGVKTEETDGYNAIVVGFGRIRQKLQSKPVKGRFDKAGIEPTRYLREIRTDGSARPDAGTTFGIDTFQPGDRVHVSGISRGHGFQGTVKRHGFRGGPKSHGQSDRLRAPGSIGASSFPSRVFKGQRMPGHMGNARVTVKNLKVVAVEPGQSLLLIGGAVPGHKDSMVLVRKAR